MQERLHTFFLRAPARLHPGASACTRTRAHAGAAEADLPCCGSILPMVRVFKASDYAASQGGTIAEKVDLKYEPELSSSDPQAVLVLKSFMA